MPCISFIMRLHNHLLLCIFSLLWAVTGVSAAAATQTPLPVDGSWRTFASPLALGTKEMLFFQRDGKQAVMWRMNWITEKANATPLAELVLEDKERYTAVSSSAGLWLLGRRTLLIDANGQRRLLDTGYDEPVATALADGSVAVFGKSRGGAGGAIAQLRLNPARGQIEVIHRGPLSYDGQTDQSGQNYRQPQYGHNVVQLQDGRLFLLGGDHTPYLASVISPQSGSGNWVAQPVAPMPNPRVGSAVVTLADGRVVVTGAQQLHCYGDAAQVRSVDIYDPVKNRWASLAPLPFTPCTDSHGADRPALAVTPDGTLVVGGHLEPHVMVLRADKASASGFASDWLVFGQFQNSRIGGVVQAISSKEVVMAGGVNNREGDFGGCCYATAGFDRVAIDASESHVSRALAYVGVGAAQRGNLVFAAGGRRFGFTGFGQMRYSAYAELIDLRTGRVQQLPNMPFVTGGAKAIWLDDDRVLVKGIPASNARGFASGENLSSSIPSSSAALAVFNLKLGRWTDVTFIDSLAGSSLLDAQGSEAFFFHPGGGSVLRLDLKTNQVQPVAQLTLWRSGAVTRLLSGNVLIAAGGQTPDERVSEIDVQCAADAYSDCPDRYIGFGPTAPTTDYESLAFGESPDVARNLLSQTVSNNAKSAAIAIGRDASVYLLASNAENTAQRLVRSVKGSRLWRSMPPPGGAKMCKDDCALMVADDPRDGKKELLFFRQGSIDQMYIDDRIASLSVNVWLWDESAHKWQRVLKTDGKSARTVPQALDAPDTSGVRLMAMGWHLDAPILWATP